MPGDLRPFVGDVMRTGSHRSHPRDLRGDWMKRARCVGYPDDYMFPDLSHIDTAQVRAIGSCHKERRGRAVCADCPVARECLTYCLDLEVTIGPQYGIWGGTTERDRKLGRTLPAEKRARFLLHYAQVEAKKEGVA